MKRLGILLAVFGLTASLSYAQAGRANGKFEVPRDVNRVSSDNLDLFGVAVDTASAAGTVTPNQGSGVARTTARLWFAGEGVFYGVSASSGAATEIVHCFDAASASETTYQTTTISLVAMVQRLTTAVTHSWGSGYRIPVRIRKGLVCDSTDNNPYIPYFEKK